MLGRRMYELVHGPIIGRGRLIWLGDQLTNPRVFNPKPRGGGGRKKHFDQGNFVGYCQTHEGRGFLEKGGVQRADAPVG